MRWAAVIGLCLVLVAGQAGAVLSLLGIKNSMVEFLLDQLSTEGVLEITAEEVLEPDSGVTAIRGLKVADRDGVFLTAEALDFAWDPTRLLRGEVEFNSLNLTGLHVLRQPILPEDDVEAAEEVETDSEEAANGSPLIAWPRSPLTLRIEAMALKNARIDEPVLGHALRFDATGSAQDEGDIQAASLDLQRTDGLTGTITFSYRRNFRRGTLAVNLDAAEAPDGLVANLADLPRDAPSEVSLRAEGPPTDWQVQLSLRLAELVEADGAAKVSYEGPVQVDADFKARPGPKMAPNIAAVMGSEARLRALVAEDADGLIRISEGRLTSPEVTAAVSGTLSRRTGAADLDVDLAIEDGFSQAIPGFDLKGIRFAGRLAGTPGRFSADGQTLINTVRSDLVDLDQADLTVVLGQDGPVDAPTTTVDLKGQTQGLRLDRISADLIGEAETQLVAALTGSVLDLQAAWLDSTLLQVSTSGRANLETGDAEVALALSTPDLEEVARAYGVEIGGEISLSANAVRKDEQIDLDLRADVDDLAHALADADSLSVEGTVRNGAGRTEFDLVGRGVAMRLDRIGPDVLPRAGLQIKGVAEGDQIDIAKLHLASPLLRATLAGEVDTARQSGSATYRVSSGNLSKVAAIYDVNAAGAIAADGRVTLSGSDAPPRITGKAAFPDLTFDGTLFGRVALTHDVLISQKPEGTLDLSVGRTPAGPVTLATGFAAELPTLRLQQVRGSALGASIRSDALVIDTERQTARGRLRISADQIARLARQAGVQAAGSLRGAVDLTPSGQRQDVSLDLSGSGLAVGGTTLGGVSAKGAVRDVTGQPVTDLALSLQDLATGPLSGVNGSLSLKGPLTGLNINTQIGGSFRKDPMTARISGRVNAGGPTVRARFNTAELSLDDASFRLNQPLNITARGSTIAVKDLDLSLPKSGFVAGELTFFGAGASGNLRLNLPDLTMLKTFADVPIDTGAATARAKFDTRRSQARANASASVTDLTFSDVDGTGAMNLDAGIDWQGRTARANATLAGNFGEPLTIRAEVPVRAGGLFPELARRGAVDAAIAWTGQIGDLWALVPAPGHVVTGDAKIDLAVSGDISAPRITGGAAVTGGGYQNLDAGTILTDLTIDTALDANGALGVKLRAADGAAGTVSTDGSISLDGNGLQVTTKIDNAVLVRREDVTARIDGQIDVKSRADGLDVIGALTIPEAEVRLVNANPPGIVTLGEVIIKGAPEIDNAPETSSTRLSIDIDAPGRLFARGRGLESEWRLGLKIRGDAANPVMSGAIERVRGQLVLIGKSFDLTRGRISFPPAEEIDPVIDVVLERETADLTGRIIVSGPASSPELTFASTPSLPEDEVLPRALFGKSSQALTTSQAVQLGIGLATLMDGGAGTLEALRGATGLDSIQVEQDDEGNASVAVGKEVAEGVWVGTKQPLGEGGTSVAVEIEVFDDITVDTEVEAGGGSSVGIQWKRDF